MQTLNPTIDLLPLIFIFQQPATMTDNWESDEKFAALAAYRGAAAATGGSSADAGGEGGEKKLSKNALKKLAKGKVRLRREFERSKLHLLV